MLERSAILDVNVLLAAILEEHAHYEVASDWIFRTLLGGRRLLVSEEACASFLRIAANPSVASSVGNVREAAKRLLEWQGRHALRVIQAGPRRLGLAVALLNELEARPRDVPDVFFAALAIEAGATLVTFDRGFARFPDLSVVMLSA